MKLTFYMLTLKDLVALHDITAQARALDKGLRAVLTRAQANIDKFNPGEPSNAEEEHWVQEAGESLMDDLAVAKDIVQNAMGVVAVLLHSHVESGLKRIYKATRGRELNGVKWVQFLDAYKRAKIDLSTKARYREVDAIRCLANCYKHDAGVPKEEFELPDGSNAIKGRVLDYSVFDFQFLAKCVVEFLKSVGEAADNPFHPRAKPKVKLEIDTDGQHILSRVSNVLDMPDVKAYDIEVERLVSDGSMKRSRFVGTISGKNGRLALPGTKSGVKTFYKLKLKNSLGECGEELRFEYIQP